MVDGRLSQHVGMSVKRLCWLRALVPAITVVVNINCQFAYAGISSINTQLAVKAWRYSTADWTNRGVEHTLTSRPKLTATEV
jgi:hypothetical protein